MRINQHDFAPMPIRGAGIARLRPQADALTSNRVSARTTQPSHRESRCPPCPKTSSISPAEAARRSSPCRRILPEWKDPAPSVAKEFRHRNPPPHRRYPLLRPNLNPRPPRPKQLPPSRLPNPQPAAGPTPCRSAAARWPPLRKPNRSASGRSPGSFPNAPPGPASVPAIAPMMFPGVLHPGPNEPPAPQKAPPGCADS